MYALRSHCTRLFYIYSRFPLFFTVTYIHPFSMRWKMSMTIRYNRIKYKVQRKEYSICFYEMYPGAISFYSSVHLLDIMVFFKLLFRETKRIAFCDLWYKRNFMSLYKLVLFSWYVKWVRFFLTLSLVIFNCYYRPVIPQSFTFEMVHNKVDFITYFQF